MLWTTGDSGTAIGDNPAPSDGIAPHACGYLWTTR